MDDAIVVLTGNPDSPRIAAHLAVLNEGAAGVRLDVDFHLLAAERTGHRELVAHSAQYYSGRKTARGRRLGSALFADGL